MFGTVTLVLYGQDWMEGFMRGIQDFDVKIIVLSNYNFNGEPVENNDETETIAKKYGAIVIRGDWRTQEEQRNAGVELLKQKKIRWSAAIDSDMLFTRDSIKTMKKIITESPLYRKTNRPMRVWSIPLIQLFKNPFYKIIFSFGEAGDYPMLLNTEEETRYIHPNKINTENDGLLEHIPRDQVFGYHFSYVRTDYSMKEKLYNYSHRHEVADSWYDTVWKRADEIGLDKLNKFGVAKPDEWDRLEKIKLPLEIWRNLPQWCRQLYPHPQQKTP